MSRVGDIQKQPGAELLQTIIHMPIDEDAMPRSESVSNAGCFGQRPPRTRRGATRVTIALFSFVQANYNQRHQLIRKAPWPLLPAHASARTKSSRRSARAAWARSTKPATSGWTA